MPTLFLLSHRAITFDPDGQKMYCASPSGLRRWSWDNDTASARLEAMGDVPWGKVGAGALHYNADGQQVGQYTNVLHICLLRCA